MATLIITREGRLVLLVDEATKNLLKDLEELRENPDKILVLGNVKLIDLRRSDVDV